MARMKTYIIEEIATYYILANSKKAAEKKFLDSIDFKTEGPFYCEVSEREVYPDPANRLTKKEKTPCQSSN